MSTSLLVITGPTASGKTRRAVDCAKALGGEIISADSRQVYRGMDIGSGKDIEEYGSVPYHLIDIKPAGYQYNLYEFLRDFNTARTVIESRGHRPILCGGTGMYVEAAVRGSVLPSVGRDDELRRELEAKPTAELVEILKSFGPLPADLDLDNPRRIIRRIELATHSPAHSTQARPLDKDKAVIVGVAIDRDERRHRISERLRSRLQNGMIEEVERLIAEGVPTETLIAYGLEYRYVTLYLTGQLDREEMERLLEIAIHQFAKRQMTWFRGMERRGLAIHWLPWDMPADEFTDTVAGLL
ncbi:MAG: tRNA (adenosine(37)-N6)-dimethylallyltransferase MiaA [Paramuribaculum sp.]|nr:tRNA (adenosine(37)-N6)-dimethylallyltransferase MiaA [Paramuribaculum sp.]